MNNDLNPIYRHFSKTELDREYSPSSCIADINVYLQAYTERSRMARASCAIIADIQYGISSDETLDFFPAPSKNAPLEVFIHGGYWQGLSKNESSFAAPDFVRAGVAFAVLNYALAPKVNLDEIVRQCRAAVAWLYQNADQLGFDRNRIFVSGSSAGAHLAAMVTATRWSGDIGTRDLGLPNDLVKGCAAVSGVFDLEPIRFTYVNDPLYLDAESARRNSPLFLRPTVPTRLLVCWGDNETAEFKRQSREFAEAWGNAGNPCELFELAGFSHFDVIFALGDTTTRLGQAVMRQIEV
jgi:arylformamidase